MKFILFEGIDGSGKTTLAKKLADRVEGVYYDSPPECIRDIKEKGIITSDEIRLQYYLLGNIIASEEIKNILKTNHVVCDRYIYSTMADHSVRLEREIRINPNLLFPDYIIYTKANLKIIEERLLMRDGRIKKGEIKFLDKVAQKIEFLLRYDNELLLGNKNVIYVDTTNRDPEGLVDLIVKQIF
ncbi:hypothetical protein J4455_05600 [Candidatus Woesearchaeota archaeon]|nr:hypothetical protein [uncultured archaeon]MBS3150129.1 hypothetical protein [Candidatus Woesearchaeota archaeon]